jgi:hypothetical protein
MTSAATLDSLDRRLRQLEVNVAMLLASQRSSAYSRSELLAELDHRIGRAREAGDLEHYRELRRIRDKHR